MKNKDSGSLVDFMIRLLLFETSVLGEKRERETIQV